MLGSTLLPPPPQQLVEQQQNGPLLAKWNRTNLNSGPSPRPRHGHKSVAIKELIIVYGGGNEGIFEDLYVYNTSTDMWYKPSVRGDAPPGLAAFGMCCDGEKIYIFGGMIDPNRYSNELYELDTRRWEYRHLRTRAPRTGGNGPVPRFGHSFNIDSDGYGYVFGGYTNQTASEPAVYLNDFYRIKLAESTPGILNWEILTSPNGPSPRESHSAVIYEQNGSKQLLLYGGMNGERLSDIWICDLRTMAWQFVQQHGVIPLSRSLHSANLIGDRMYVFGGWVPVQGEEISADGQPAKTQWKCSNDLCCFNVLTRTWENFAESLVDADESLPKPRAGHCSAVVHDRVYIWSGREGVRRMLNSQICCNDMHFIETSAPHAPKHLQLVRASTNGVEIQWGPVPTATDYLLQIFKVASNDGDQSTNSPGMLQSRRVARPSGPTSQQQAAGQNGQVTRFYLSPQNNAVVRMPAPNNALTPTPSGILASTPQQMGESLKSTPQYNNSPYVAYSTPANQPVNQQMPTNILDESFNDSDLNETNESQNDSTTNPNQSSSSAQSPSKLVDPASISLSDVPTTPAPSETNSTANMTDTTTTNSLAPPNDPEPSIPAEAQQNVSAVEAPVTNSTTQAPASDVPADPPNAQPSAVSDVPAQEPAPQSAAETPAKEAPIDANPPQTPNNTPQQNEQPPAVDPTPVQPPEETWHDVGTVKKATSYHVTHYFIDENPNEAERRKAALDPGTQYKFRVAAINSCGQSAWSQEATFRTCIPGYPGAPSSIKITKGADCAILKWAPPQVINGNICEYSVYLAMRGTSDNSSSFLRVYAGPEASCSVPNKTLMMAMVDNTPKPAVIFRIAARNEKGYGPATQVRWLQESRPQVPTLGARQSPLIHAHQSQQQQQQANTYKRIRLD